MTTLKITAKHLTINGKKIAITVSKGPWIEGVNPDLIKLRPRGGNLFPASVKNALTVENNSDSRTDYFEPDCIRLLPGHALYEAAKNL